jgi:hypothetical protein
MSVPPRGDVNDDAVFARELGPRGISVNAVAPGMVAPN